MMTQSYQPASPNLPGIVFAGFEEIVGRADLTELFPCEPETHTASDTPDWLASLNCLEARFGRSGAQGVAHRAGRASFHHWLRQFGEPLQLDHLEFRLMPADRRLRFGFEALAKTLQLQWGMAIEQIEDEHTWRWQLTDCAACSKNGQAACCSYLAGLLQEYLCWISGGKFFPADETQRSECGRRVCEVILRKQPLD